MGERNEIWNTRFVKSVAQNMFDFWPGWNGMLMFKGGDYLWMVVRKIGSGVLIVTQIQISHDGQESGNQPK